MYYKSYDLLHIHIPKTAGTAVRYLLDSQLEPGEGYVHGYYESLKQFTGQNTKIITIVRDPFERIISFYNWIQAGKSDLDYDFVKQCYKKPFKEFVDIYCEHGECEFDFIRGCEDKIHFIHFEKLARNLHKTMKQLGIPVDVSKLKSVYKIPRIKMYYYDHDSIQKVRRKDWEYYDRFSIK